MASNENDNLKEELNKYWDWAGITPEEYSQGKAPEHARQAEWEDDYPDWRQFDSLIENAIENLSQNWDENIAELIVLIIAIDNENGLIMDKCLEKFVDRDGLKLIEMCCKSNQPYARLEIAERVESLTVSDELKLLLQNDTDKRVRQAFLQVSNSHNR